jgi:hypothetical protein
MLAVSPLIAVVSAFVGSMVCSSLVAQSIPAAGPVDISDQKVKIVANFEEGVDSPFSIASDVTQLFCSGG